MSLKSEQLTSEQINLISAHKDKWVNIANSTQRIDRNQAEKIVNSVYKIFGYKPPTVLFFDSPCAASNFILGQTDKQLEKLFGKPREMDYDLHKWHDKLVETIYSQIDVVKIYSQVRQLGLTQHFEQLRSSKELLRWEGLDYQIGNHIWQKLHEQSEKKIQKYLGRNLYRFTRPSLIINNSVCTLDYYISFFELNFEKEKWEKYKSLLQLGNFIFLQEKACLICDRPIKMSFDSENFLHAECQLAIEFADSSGLYSYHGVTLPQKYGKFIQKQWQPKWLSEETNPEIRAVLVKGIGYVRICQELSVIEIDSWHNYLLVTINISIDLKAIYLLEININNGVIERAKEIPSDVKSVQEAISFVDDWEIEQSISENFDIPF